MLKVKARPRDPDVSGSNRRRGNRRTKGLIGLVAALLALALLGGIALQIPVVQHFRATQETRGEAGAAIEVLRDGDLAALGQHLSTHRADPVFAYYFTTQASPRELGDALAVAAYSAFLTSAEAAPLGGPADSDTVADGTADQDRVEADSDSTAYERTLTDLADTLALATHGTGDLALPASWTDDFTTYTTNPRLMYYNATDDQERIDQDLANKQNLLLLLSRGQWSTDFLQATTEAYWESEHGTDGSEEADPWPGRTLEDARYAPAPSGTYLTDGMVALMAALTANPEAAGWAFAGFQPTTATLNYSGADHQIGTFAHYIFFEHRYAESSATGTPDSGMSASFTALASAIQATGGSYGDHAAGPLADAFVLQDYQQAMAAEQDAGPWYHQLVRWVGTYGHFALDAFSLIPVIGVPFDVINAAWYAVEGDWADAGLSVLTIIPVVGAVGVAGKLAKDGVKAGNLIDRAGNTIDEATDAGRLLTKATGIGHGVFSFNNAHDYLAALKNPVPGVSYRYGATTYELAPDGKTLTHVSGPDRETLKRTLPNETHPGRNMAGECISSECRAASKLKEEEGIQTYEAEKGPCERKQVLARSEAMANGRFYDCLALKSDGTYEGVEVKSGNATRTPPQQAFDNRIDSGNPATAKLDDRLIEVTSTFLQLTD